MLRHPDHFFVSPRDSIGSEWLLPVQFDWVSGVVHGPDSIQRRVTHKLDHMEKDDLSLKSSSIHLNSVLVLRIFGQQKNKRHCLVQLDNLKDLSSRSVSVLKYVALSGFQPPLQTPVDSSAARSSNDLFGSVLVDLNSSGRPVPFFRRLRRSDGQRSRRAVQIRHDDLLAVGESLGATKQLREEGYIMVYYTKIRKSLVLREKHEVKNGDERRGSQKKQEGREGRRGARKEWNR